MSKSWLEMTIPVWFQSETSTFSVWHFRFESLWVACLFGMEMGLICWLSFGRLLVYFIDLFVFSFWRKAWGKDHEGRTGTACCPSAQVFGICRSLGRCQSCGEIRREAMFLCSFYPGIFPRNTVWLRAHTQPGSWVCWGLVRAVHLMGSQMSSTHLVLDYDLCCRSVASPKGRGWESYSFPVWRGEGLSQEDLRTPSRP